MRFLVPTMIVTVVFLVGLSVRPRHGQENWPDEANGVDSISLDTHDYRIDDFR